MRQPLRKPRHLLGRMTDFISTEPLRILPVAVFALLVSLASGVAGQQTSRSGSNSGAANQARQATKQIPPWAEGIIAYQPTADSIAATRRDGHAVPPWVDADLPEPGPDGQGYCVMGGSLSAFCCPAGTPGCSGCVPFPTTLLVPIIPFEFGPAGWQSTEEATKCGLKSCPFPDIFCRCGQTLLDQSWPD